MPTIKDLLIFILKNRHKGHKTFVDLSIPDIVRIILSGIQDNTISYAIDKDGQIIGVVYVVPNKLSKTILISQIISNERWVVKAFIKTLIQFYPGYILESDKRNKHRVHNTPKLISKILCQHQHNQP